MNNLLLFGVTPHDATSSMQIFQGLLTSLLVTILLSFLMMACYRLCHDSLTYNKKFNITLMMLALSSTVLLTLIQDNPMLSLGAVGAMSICRIRTNTRDPRDLGFVFWSLTIGMSSALGVFMAGLLGSLLLGAIILAFTKLEHKQKDLTIVVRGEKSQIPEVHELFQTVPRSTIQSQNVFPDSFELVYTVDMPKEKAESLLLRINAIHGVNSVNILAPETRVA